ncbi:MAG: redoxin domain-containing protein [Candidatus Latescibacteria bacterium]|nr:redoxin domain-containing protein [Candidatus Latescibacterota bacterium]NIM66305.1 redoxin domain-containing protein [Candidatus Latescibacterota bacterium]NIO02784.1 redoxin domain-containing protein [Candidatus Latescibacterota bacterium]NIO29919.1 redoxin domain-containing protein [Candidatus Latescibacterota bacterium]NIO57534.1 redoxin domain-containing protein [Candidatus Latescibacterota bacterium]
MKAVPSILTFALFLLPQTVPAPVAAENPQSAVPGSRAPLFDMPLLSGDGYMNSRELFSSHAYTFLVFWESGCPHCVELLTGCELFYQDHATENIGVFGIHLDEGNLFEVSQLIEANGITFPQAWDTGGEAAQNYNAPLGTFTLFLVDQRGEIIARKPDPEGDIQAIMKEMLAAEKVSIAGREVEEVAVPGGEEADEGVRYLGGIVFRGDQRIRFLGIDARGMDAAGPYGEEVHPGNNLLFRFELEMSRRLGRHVRIGGLLRISNEGKEVLEAGPKYLGSEWGSAYAEITARRFLLRLGYYEIFMTPLTLMRWDWDDNPRVGGNASCGCGATAGILLVKSLEELNPELTFEGGITFYRSPNIETRAFYAIPRRATETTYLEVRSTGAERADYSLEIYGFESLWKKFDSRTGSSWKAGLHLVGSWENRHSVDFIRLGYPVVYPWNESILITATWNVPIVRSVDLRGEWIVWNQAKSHGFGVSCCDDLLKVEGRGGIAGVVFERLPVWRFRADYLYLTANFYSPFAALSYEPDREGVRFSTDIPVFRDVAVVSLFYKRLRELEVLVTGADREKASLLGASIDVELPNGLGGGVGWLDHGKWRKGSVSPFDEVRKALVVTTRYGLNKNSSVQLQYQRIDGRITWSDQDSESLTNLFSVYLTGRF